MGWQTVYRSEIRTISMILVLLISSLFLSYTPKTISILDEADGALTSIDPIVIEKNSELAVHSAVRSGVGTTLNPYVISDFSIDSYNSGRYGIAIRNTTAHLIIRNVTIRVADSSVGVFLWGYNWNPLNIVLKNITITGGTNQIYLYLPVRVSITECKFVNPSLAGDAIYSYYGYENFFSNNTFSCPNMDINIDYTSSLSFVQNRGTLRRYDHLNFRYSNFANNTFDINSVLLYSGYYSDLQGNRLSSRVNDEVLLYLIDCNRIKTANNTFNGGYHSIYVYHPNAYSPVLTNYPQYASLRFEYNHINGSLFNGINLYYTTGHPAMTYFNILYNRFTNCTQYAISLRGGGSPTSVVWHNIFQNNHGSDDTFSGIKVQVEDYYGQFSWDNGIIGNYWKDKRGPDDDSDGFVDDNGYPVGGTSSRKDNHPISNPYFDFEKPALRIITPKERFVRNSYVNITWEVSDDLSGIYKIEVRNGLQPWIDATYWDDYGLFLVQGNYKVKVRATDKALLRNEVEFEIFVNRTILPYTVISPVEGLYYNSSIVPVTWSIDESFVPLDLTYQLNGGPPVVMDPWVFFDIDAPEGVNELDLVFHDHYGNGITRSIQFTVDVTDPTVDILFPVAGSVISNDLVNFQWKGLDNSGAVTTFVRIDDGDLLQKSSDHFSEILGAGPHTIQVIVFDQAGNKAGASMDFVIAQNTSLNLISPRLIVPTSRTVILVEWEYLVGNLQIESLELIIDNQPSIVLDTTATSREITLNIDGPHRITVQAQDPAGNVISDTVDVIIDTVGPVPDFQFPTPGAYLNYTNVDLKWNAVERWGLDRFELYADGILKAGGLKQGSFSIDLSPGEHVLKIKGFDLAGNMGIKEITIFIDMSVPVLDLVEPIGGIFTGSYITFAWTGEDDFEIDHYNFSLDQRPVEELGLATSRQIQVSEGEHVFILRCSDLAGNTRIIRKEFLVDLNDPEVSFKHQPNEFVKSFLGLIEWEIMETIGIGAISLSIDGVDYEVSTTSTYFILEMETGRHEVSIEVVDLSGRHSNAGFIFNIDPDPPMISKPDRYIDVKGSSAVIYWELDEEQGNLTKTLMIDGDVVTVNFALSDGMFTFAELEPGNHTVTLDVNDRAGNGKTLTWEFHVQSKEPNGSSSSNIAGILIAVSVVLILIVLAAGSVYLFRRKDPREGSKTIQSPKKPEKLTFGQRPSLQVPVPHQHISRPLYEQPSATASTIHRPKEHGYIRPEAPKNKVERTIIDAPSAAPITAEKRPPYSSSSNEVHPEVSQERKKIDQVEEWGEIEDWEGTEEIEDWEDMEEL